MGATLTRKILDLKLNTKLKPTCSLQKMVNNTALVTLLNYKLYQQQIRSLQLNRATIWLGHKSN